MLDEGQHGAWVDSWLKRSAKDLSPQALLQLFERAFGALWARTQTTLGEVTLTKGGVKDRTVSFQFDVTSFGPALVFLLKGDLDAQVTAMKGMVSVSGFDAPFTAVRQ